jgi:hypothetical protein
MGFCHGCEIHDSVIYSANIGIHQILKNKLFFVKTLKIQ